MLPTSLMSIHNEYEILIDKQESHPRYKRRSDDSVLTRVADRESNTTLRHETWST